MRRIGCRTNHHEVIVHHLEALHALPLGHELFLGLPVMYEHHVGIAAPSDIEGLSGTNGDDFHLNAALRCEGRQQVTEQTRLLCRCRRCHGNRTLLRDGGHRDRYSDEQKKQALEHHAIPLFDQRALLVFRCPNKYAPRLNARKRKPPIRRADERLDRLQVKGALTPEADRPKAVSDVYGAAP